MAWNRIQAARLLSDKEMALFEGSLSDEAAQRASTGSAGSKSAGRNTVRSAVKAAFEAGSDPSGKPQAQRSKKAPAQGVSGGDVASPDAQSGPAEPHAKRMQEMGQQRPLAHVSSRGRRQQARRDSR